MKRFDITSFLIGLGGAVAVGAARHRLRPVFVELAAAGIHLGKLGFAVIERQREHAEDLWAEIDERVRQRVQGHARPDGRRQTRRAGANGAGVHISVQG